MRFDSFTVVLLQRNHDAPALDDAAADALQDAHLAHLATLHEEGLLLAAGPLDDSTYRGLCLMSVDAERALELSDADPAVQAGRFTVKAIPWLVPGGAVSFSPTRFPHSIAEARAD